MMMVKAIRICIISVVIIVTLLYLAEDTFEGITGSFSFDVSGIESVMIFSSSVLLGISLGVFLSVYYLKEN